MMMLEHVGGRRSDFCSFVAENAVWEENMSAFNVYF